MVQKKRAFRLLVEGRLYGLVKGFPKAHSLDGLEVGIALGAPCLDGLDLEIIGLADDGLLGRGAIEVSFHFVPFLVFRSVLDLFTSRIIH